MISYKSNKIYVLIKETIDRVISLGLIKKNFVYTSINITNADYPNYKFTKKYHIVNNIFLLQYLKKTFFTEKDARAGWFGAAFPYTNNQKFKPLAIMALTHLRMYLTFFHYLKKKDSRILDIGCGIGYATVCMADNWSDAVITAIDYDKEAIAFAKKINNLSNINYVCVDFLQYQSEEKFDYIFAIDILEHIPSDQHDIFIDRSLSFLDKDGLLFLITPNAVNEEDAEHTHIGLLNKNRIRNFIKKYKSHFIEESFIIDELLIREKYINDLFVISSLGEFKKFQNKYVKNYTSHVRVILQK